ncbi:MAG: hypothetical protein WBP59_03115 [Ilumatobacteraceae bacterium]
MDTITPEYEIIEVETPGRRRKITKFALAGVAVLGVGAALTSAAWSDNVTFFGDASTGTLDLKGQDINGDWVDADSGEVTIALPSDAFDEIGPNISDTYRIRVFNDGSLPIALTTGVAQSETGALFGGLKPATITVGDWNRATINPQQQAWADVTVTGGDWNGSEYQGAVGTLEIDVQGQTIDD